MHSTPTSQSTPYPSSSTPQSVSPRSTPYPSSLTFSLYPLPHSPLPTPIPPLPASVLYSAVLYPPLFLHSHLLLSTSQSTPYPSLFTPRLCTLLYSLLPATLPSLPASAHYYAVHSLYLFLYSLALPSTPQSTPYPSSSTPTSQSLPSTLQSSPYPFSPSFLTAIMHSLLPPSRPLPSL